MNKKDTYYAQEEAFKVAKAERVGDGRYKIISPLRLSANKGIRVPIKFFHINFNNMISANPAMIHALKKQYYGIMRHQVESLPRISRASFCYTVHRGGKGTYDYQNICSGVDKFASDALVLYGAVEDDSSEFFTGTHYLPGEIDRELPHCEVIIQEVQ